MHIDATSFKMNTQELHLKKKIINEKMVSCAAGASQHFDDTKGAVRSGTWACSRSAAKC